MNTLQTTDQRGLPYQWNGHLCEGDQLEPFGTDLYLWTRCGKHDVPANKAHTGGDEEVTCLECLQVAQ